MDQSSGDSYNCLIAARSEQAKKVLQARNFDVTQHCGQRISTNLDVNADQVNGVDWNEIFIGKLPRDLFEDELLPIIECAGTVYKIRYMMDFSGTCRGFAFVKYTQSSEAARACKILNDYIIRIGRPPIGVKMSFDNKCLYFGNLPKECTSDKLLNVLRKADVKGIVAAKMSPKTDKTKSRFAHVTFESHDAATKARRLLLPGDVRLFHRKITMDWAKVKPPETDNFLKEGGGGGYDDEIIDADNVITVFNVDQSRISLDKLKTILEVGGLFKIVDIGHFMVNDLSGITIKYLNKNAAFKMAETIRQYPHCFEQLALPNQMLIAW